MGETYNKRPLGVLVGAGPGGAELISQEGLRWLSQADVVIYDRLIDPTLLQHCGKNAELIYVGKGAGEHTMTQEKINQVLVEKCAEGKLVVRLKGGDPLVFGRGGEEADALVQAKIPFRIVPGITAAVAAGAYVGIPLTDRRLASSLALVTGHEDPTKEQPRINWSGLAKVDTVVFYMGVANLPAIAKKLINAGRSARTPVAVIEHAATPQQRTVIGKLSTIGELAAKAGVRPPALVIVGAVVDLHGRLSWYESLPLFGQTVIVTRARHQASGLAQALKELGAHVIEAPTVEIRPPENFDAVDAELRRLTEYDWLVLTSPNGAEALFERLDALGLDARRLGGVKVAAVGTGTAAALREHNIRADLVPQTFTTEALGKALVAAIGTEKRRVLVARSDIATPGLAEALLAAGVNLREITIYTTARPRSLPEEAIAALKAGTVDWITFTSSSTVTNFLDLIEPLYLDIRCVRMAAIGPVTGETLLARSLPPTVTAAPHTIRALVEAIEKFCLDHRIEPLARQKRM